jgi:hypothetical protein
MKRIKSIIKVALIAVLPTTVFISCKKYLSPEAISSFDTEYVFNNIPNAQKSLLGAYMAMAGDYGYGIRLSGYWAYDSDEMMKGTSTTTSDEGQLLAKYQGIPGNLQITNPFNQLYQGIERANLCIYFIPKMNLYINGTSQQQAQLKRMHGEALVLRAQYYYELCRNFGDVPAQWGPSQFEADLFKSRMSRDSIYDQLLSDLELAATMMPWRKEVAAIGDAVDQRFTICCRLPVARWCGRPITRIITRSRMMNVPRSLPAGNMDWYLLIKACSKTICLRII